MLEKLKKNMNEWHYHSLAVTILAIITILKYEEVVLSVILITISTVLNGIGALYNQNKRTEEMLKKLILKSREEVIYERLKEYEEKGDRKYEYNNNDETIMLNKAELLNIFMKEEREIKCH